MAKEDTSPEPSSAPEVDPANIDLDVDKPPAEPSLDPEQTIEEAQAAVEPKDSDDDDAIYREAASEVIKDESEQAAKPKKSKKKIIAILVLTILLACGAVAAWYFLVRDKPAPSQQAQTTTTEETSKQEIGFTPYTVAYAFRESEDVPYTLFWRPADGGDRTQVEKLSRDEFVNHSDAYGQSVVYSTDTTIKASIDGGKTYQAILELGAGEQVTSLKISTTGKNVAVAVAPDNNEGNTVKAVPLAGGEPKELYSSDKAGVFLYNWNEDKKQIVFGDGCYNCDGNTLDWQLLNLDDKKVTKLAEDIKSEEASAHAVSFDGSKIVIVTGVIDGSADGIGYATTAPYKIQLLDVASNEVTEVASVGSAGEKNTNGTVRHRDIKVGFLAGTVTPYYVDDTNLYTLSGDKPNAFYESSEQIQSVSFVDDKNVIAGIGKTWDDYALINFNVETGESVTIFQGDANTNIFGVTTQ